MALQVDAWGGRVVTMEMDPVNVTWSHSGSVKGVVWQGQVGARRPDFAEDVGRVS